MTALLAGIEALGFARYVRESTWAYPALEVMHLVGIGALFGSLLTLDARLLGARRGVALPALARVALRVTAAGFVVAACSGLLLLASRATELVPNPAFLAKMGLIAAAGVNAWAFHRRHALEREDRIARWQGAASIALWIGVIAAGRWIAYVR